MDERQRFLFDTENLEDGLFKELAKSHNAVGLEVILLKDRFSMLTGSTDDESTRFHRMMRFIHKFLPFTDKIPAYSIMTSFFLMCLTVFLKSIGVELKWIAPWVSNFVHLMMSQ
jgi:hypothetical protein